MNDLIAVLTLGIQMSDIRLQRLDSRVVTLKDRVDRNYVQMSDRLKSIEMVLRKVIIAKKRREVASSTNMTDNNTGIVDSIFVQGKEDQHDGDSSLVPRFNMTDTLASMVMEYKAERKITRQDLPEVKITILRAEDETGRIRVVLSRVTSSGDDGGSDQQIKTLTFSSLDDLVKGLHEESLLYSTVHISDAENILSETEKAAISATLTTTEDPPTVFYQ